MLHKDLKIWKRSRTLSIQVYKTLINCKDYGFKDQITRSSLSIPSNIAEGCGRSSLKEQRHFMSIARGSLYEFSTQTDIGIEVSLIHKKIGEGWMLEAIQLGLMLDAFIKSIDRQLKQN